MFFFSLGRCHKLGCSSCVINYINPFLFLSYASNSIGRIPVPPPRTHLLMPAQPKRKLSDKASRRGVGCVNLDTPGITRGRSHPKRGSRGPSGPSPPTEAQTSFEASQAHHHCFISCSFQQFQGTQTAESRTSNSSIPPSDSRTYSVPSSIASSSSVEYEIGRLICYTLDMVGDLVSLNTSRFQITNPRPPTQHSLNILTVEAALHQALDQTAAAQGSTTSTILIEPLRDSTIVPLSRSEVRQIGRLFSRNPTALHPVVLQMWYTNCRRLDISAILSPPSLLVS